MIFELTDEQKRFKEKICRFLDTEVTEEVREESDSGLGWGPHSWRLMQRLGAKGWLAPTFPVEYGGLGLSRIYRFIVQHELDYRNALAFFKGVGLVGVDMAAPVILRHGSEELKKEFLPRIARGEIDLALGYTEPDAGSDLSKISIQAVEDGDDFVITGQKTFNSHCHFAHYHWLAARTGAEAPSHKGISLFLVDFKLPGITLNPLWEISGGRTNEVFYDQVRVPGKYLVGEKDMGWYYMTEALDLERMLTLGACERVFEQIVAYAKRTSKNGMSLAEDPSVRDRLTDLFIELSIARNHIRRVVWMQDKGIPPTHETAILKVFVTELHQKIARAGLEILGPYGQIRKDSKYAVLEGMLEHFFRASFVMTIGGGTSEIMRNIIAIRGLGLPR